MFLTEKEMRDKFWEFYNNKGRAIKYQFEAPVRTGSVDLLTIESYQGNFQINTFEFKLNDIQKVILQAKENMKYSHKSWIVVPEEKTQVLQNRYLGKIREMKYVGVIVVQEGGRWNVIQQPQFKRRLSSLKIFLIS